MMAKFSDSKLQSFIIRYGISILLVAAALFGDFNNPGFYQILCLVAISNEEFNRILLDIEKLKIINLTVNRLAREENALQHKPKIYRIKMARRLNDPDLT